ncbi:MAG: LacI family transcriptional regulator [Oscillospiraceae bacterium]|jgi:LacI family transcriptional regulator|nr:LacI family transcriptional regulator [Oscillospiraceae bacterium]
MSSFHPTTIDIAKLAGVSQSAVSMILNHPDDAPFTAETISKVLKAAEKLGYKKRRRAVRSPFSFPKDTILIMCPVLSNPYYSSLVQAIEQTAFAKGYSTVTCSTYRDIGREQKILSRFAHGGLCGIVFTFIPQSCELVEELNQTIPVVVIGDRNTSIGVDTVEIDSIRSGELVAEHLLKLGHTNIAFLSTALNEQNAVRLKRLEGIRQFYRRFCPEGNILVSSETDSSEDDLQDPMIEQNIGFRLMKNILDHKKITAVIAVNDMVAYGAITSIIQAGFSVPKDYSVCGFDNIFASQFPQIFLTTVEHFILEKGHNAMNILDERIRSGKYQSESITRVEYQPRLIIRKSTGKPRI